MPKDAPEGGRLAVWLGLADNPFTRQKTVRFGDASAVNVSSETVDGKASSLMLCERFLCSC